ncbi:trypsin-like peptidase domain-containing protein [Rhodopirellula sp. JC740]|uniref:Trypsin-like peptidase domain-containing protein n=1 Tax=Rhodopirellula halodulae TaxID=2894198 RepID=A0ABS8NIQ4_9BACT|nr:trypsin-like peptidase domain-containing protein [Rhodopirellula sp. JC740]MCC9643437.1 trypsin-like peptidase domain-containing protein [Rhodopirellula sp. JC740]
MRQVWTTVGLLGLVLWMSETTQAQRHPSLDPQSPRWSPLVEVIAKVEPAVVGLFLRDESTGGFQTGSGTIIHPAGYVLTNDHVLSKDEGYAVLGKKATRFEVVGRMPEKDIAIVRLLHVKGRLPTVPLGQSNDVHNGEAVVVAGNPGGRGMTITSGIISSKKTYLDMPNALIGTQYNLEARDDFIRFDAASNRGNSGGPLVNMEGKIIGIVSRVNPEEQNASFAIPIDRVRRLFRRVVEPELRHNQWVGAKLNPLADVALVSVVERDSPAERAGLQPGDTVASVNGLPVNHAADWSLALDHAFRESESLEVVAIRRGASLPLAIATESVRPMKAVQSDEIVEGIAFRLYHGEFKKLPSFETMEVARSGEVATLNLREIQADREDDFALVLDAFIQVPENGLYRFQITSDDGSRVFLHDNLFLDHDGNHPPMTVSRLLRAEAGLHPVRIEYFEGGGHQALTAKLIPIAETSGDTESDEGEPESASGAEELDELEAESDGLKWFRSKNAT